MGQSSDGLQIPVMILSKCNGKPLGTFKWEKNVVQFICKKITACWEEKGQGDAGKQSRQLCSQEMMPRDDARVEEFGTKRREDSRQKPELKETRFVDVQEAGTRKCPHFIIPSHRLDRVAILLKILLSLPLVLGVKSQLLLVNSNPGLGSLSCLHPTLHPPASLLGSSCSPVFSWELPLTPGVSFGGGAVPPRAADGLCVEA